MSDCGKREPFSADFGRCLPFMRVLPTPVLERSSLLRDVSFGSAIVVISGRNRSLHRTRTLANNEPPHGRGSHHADS